MRCGDEFGLEFKTGMGCLTLYYDSVEELGRLACFKCLLFRFEEDHFRIEYVAFTLTRGTHWLPMFTCKTVSLG